MNTTISFAAGTDVGLRRENNEDSAYAGPRLQALADGMGGHVGGEIASSTAIEALRSFDGDCSPGELASTLGLAVDRAGAELRRTVESRPELASMGTTLTALLWSADKVAIAHIGDSRGYRLRDGELLAVTEDHTMERMLPDGGPAKHFRHVLTRFLDGRSSHVPDVSVHEVRPGDRYLLCSDGLTDVTEDDTVREVLMSLADPDEAIEQLIQLALAGGGPDNVTCVIADVVAVGTPVPSSPVLVGAVSERAVPH